MSKMIDMTGQQFGDWTVLRYDESSKGSTAKWICRCVCGNEKSVAGPSLRRGESKGCGCRKAINSRENNGTFVNEIGNRYGKLVVVAKDEELSIVKHRAHWVCKCDCGNFKTVSSKCLRDGKTKSCGCILSVGEEEVAKLLTKYNSLNILIEKWRRIVVKKFIGLFLICLVVILSCIAIVRINNDNEKEGLMHITVAEVAHSVFYAPQYVAHGLGYFEEEGLDVEIVLTSGADNVMAAVLSGDADIGFSGSEATIYVYNGGEKDYVMTFAG
jgi:hypothetical protein